MRSVLLGRADDIAGPPDGVQQGPIEAPVDLGAQPGDVGLHDVGLGVEVEVPDLLQQHGARHDLSGVAHQVFEDLQLLRQQFDALAGARDVAAQQIDLEVADLERRHRRDGRPSGEGADARQKLGEGEGLDQIVVGAGFEAFDAVVDAAHGGEEQCRRRGARGTRGLDQRQAVHLGQVAIDDHHVVALAGCEIEAVATVVGAVDHVAMLAQALGDVVGGLLVVFYEEDFHGLPSICRGAWGQRRPTIQTFNVAAMGAPSAGTHIPRASNEEAPLK